MPLEIEAHTRAGRPARGAAHPAAPARRDPILIGLINNMPDSALQSTETQFGGLLHAAAGPQEVRLRLSSLPQLPRSPEALEHLTRSYWPIDEFLADPPDALIVTGTEPRAPRLADEPYWQRLVELLAWTEAHTIASVWSCLAAHAVVEILDGIQRQRLAEKRCGVYAHSILEGHPLLAGVSAPLMMPHSRWNELPPGALRAAGYTLLSWSADTGADAFVRQAPGRSLLVFFQGHPEYEATTLLREYRRDVGRYLSGQQPHYPTFPCGYFSADATAALSAFRDEALVHRSPALLERFPFTTVAAALKNTWRPAAVAIYRNWLSLIAAARSATRPPETVSLAPL
jgi:homoserine O-succinyltransferase/O-acetyltransferase